MIRRFGEAKRSEHRYTRRPGAYAVLIKGSQILLTHQALPFDEFQLPGGGIDPGETGVRALYREVIEETGWTISKPRKLGAYRRYTFMPEYDLWAEKICHIYAARPVRRLGPPSESGHSAHWVGFDTALDLLCNDGDRHFLSGALGIYR